MLPSSMRSAPSEKSLRIRVLVVEDDPILQAVITEVLLVGGHEVRAVDRLEGVRASMETFTPEVVLLDWNLPDGSGTDVLPALQRDWPGTAVIMMSGSGTTNLTAEAIRDGAFSFLAKPFQVDELLLAVERACNRKGRRESSAQTIRTQT
jgi:DNA-binding NtrC family response regulator